MPNTAAGVLEEPFSIFAISNLSFSDIKNIWIVDRDDTQRLQIGLHFSGYDAAREAPLNQGHGPGFRAYLA